MNILEKPLKGIARQIGILLLALMFFSSGCSTFPSKQSPTVTSPPPKTVTTKPAEASKSPAAAPTKPAPQTSAPVKIE